MTVPGSALPIVGVMGSGSEAHEELAVPLGRLLAELGCHLLTGGGGGVMAAVGAAFVAVEPRVGRSIGVLPGPDARPGYPNPSVEIAIRTHLLPDLAELRLHDARGLPVARTASDVEDEVAEHLGALHDFFGQEMFDQL